MKIELYGNRELLNIGKLELHTGEVHIWKLRWRELETFWNRHKPILEKEECQKAEHYRFHEDKNALSCRKDCCENVIERVFR